MKNRLKELRQLCQWSQSDIARELGISRQAVNGFESGKFDPSLDMAFRISRLFRATIEDVFIYEENLTMAKSVGALIESVKNFFGFEFGFERFTEKAINAINFARNEAARSESPQVEPGHLLAGLMADVSTTSAHLLKSSGVNLDIETNEHSFEFRDKLEFSPQSKFILELALQIVRLKGKKSIGTEHLLWGLVQLSATDKTVLSELIQGSGLDLEALNTQLIQAI